ncbi:MAG: glycoside hydrolase family 25 protein [Oscillospiraceae bacterium]
MSVLEQTEDVLPENKKEFTPRRGLRPEWILAMVAGGAAVLLVLALIFARPYFPQPKEELPEVPSQQYQEEDPEALPQHPLEEDPGALPGEDNLEPEDSDEEPENPTIPPDRNPYDQFDFQYDRHNYLKLQNLHSYAGVDVSAYQGKIDWKKVKASGIDFAIIRLGYRGYESGKLVEDDYAKTNLKGATEAGLKVGAYFFSQALSIKETDEEIKFILKILGDTKLEMPLVLDWEIPANTARTRNMDATTLTDIQRHFCGQVRDKGYQPMIYFNWHQSEKLYYLSELEEYPFWLALYQDRMTYPWKIEMWQYTDKGKVPGIQGNVDLNVYMPD